jgi:energy-converting hydrogenase Eha subunit G
MHEAAHAAVALELGLMVEFTSIDDVQEIEITREEAQLYPQIRAGMKVPALCTRLDPKSLRTEPKKVMVAMVAPSCLTTGHPDVDTYAEMESCIAVRVCKLRGLDPDEICDWAKREMDRPSTQEMLLRLAGQLTLHGYVDLSGLNRRP